jgi:Right handed beta helix region
MIGTKARLASVAAIAVAATMVYATPAAAQATRTWVSGVGDDVNPCSRTAPCKTFAGAISKTAAGGEINCLDPGGFGAVTVIKSMTITCHYTEGGALAGGNGIVFNMPATTDVGFIRGLDIFWVNPPTNGVRFVNNGSLHIEDCTIRRFNASGSFGVSYQPAGASELYISNTTIAENGNANTGGGVLIRPTGATGSAKVVLQNVRIQNNANNGLKVDSTGNTGGGITVVMEDSQVTGNDQGVAVASALGTATIGIMIEGSNLSNNGGFGLVANGSVITIRVGDTTITGNATGVATAGGATITSFGTNRLFGNPTVGAANNGTFTGAVQPQN